MKTIARIVLSIALLVPSLASADEMDWHLKNRTKMKCSLKDGMTLRHGNDFVETKKLVCWNGMDLAVTATVACGPEGSTTRFDGRKIKVTCKTQSYARK